MLCPDSLANRIDKRIAVLHTGHMTTSSQNSAHRNDTVWIKTGGRVRVGGENYLSEYTNGFTGQKIRKDWRMTGQDWIIFDAHERVMDRAHSLTWAKLWAAQAVAA